MKYTRKPSPIFTDKNGAREYQWFQGRRYYRYPNSTNANKYFTNGARKLHREVYKAVIGPIPPGYEVHHKDTDPAHNSPENLEAIAKRDHIPTHHAYFGRSAEHMANIREKAKNWHRTDEGRAFHREIAKKSQEAQRNRVVTLVCDWCGEPFIVMEHIAKRRNASRFCSANCKARARYASGVDNVTDECEVCHKPFVHHRYNHTKTCSRKCAATLRPQNKPKV